MLLSSLILNLPVSGAATALLIISERASLPNVLWLSIILYTVSIILLIYTLLEDKYSTPVRYNLEEEEVIYEVTHNVSSKHI